MIVTSCVKICNMPYIKINDANIYYQEHGDGGGIPIVLIHGSTIDSHTDWDSIIPALAKEYKVFAPDCRGHGRSNNPNMSYSFKELADDVKAYFTQPNTFLFGEIKPTAHKLSAKGLWLFFLSPFIPIPYLFHFLYIPFLFTPPFPQFIQN